MKKSIYWLSAAAMLASCSDDMLENASTSKAKIGKGVEFEIVEDAATRGMVDKDYSSFFFAEQDRVDIHAVNVMRGGALVADDYSDFAVYKATASKGNPCLTAIDDTNIVELLDDDNNPATDETGYFLVAYPQGQAVTYDKVSKKFTITPGVDLSTQSMDKYMNFDKRLLYQYTSAKKENFYDAAGEKIQLSLNSPLYMLRPSITDVETYSSMFGDLQSVEVTSAKSPLIPGVAGLSTVVTESDLTKLSNGKTYLTSSLKYEYPVLSAADVIEIGGVSYIKSTCAYANGVWYLTSASKTGAVGGPDTTKAKIYSLYADSDPVHDIEAKVGDPLSTITNDDTFTVDTADGSIKYNKVDAGAVNKATLNISASTEIKNNTEMNLWILPQIHAGVAENYAITYKFDKVWLKYTKSIDKDLVAGGTGAVKLTIADEFPYIVTMGTGGAKRSLIVNKGSIAAAVNASDEIIWTDEYATSGVVDPANISEVLINKGVNDLTDADWNALNLMTAATKITFLNSTATLKDISGMVALEEVYANNITTVAKTAFGGATNTTIKKLELAKVTSIEGVTKFTALTDLNLGSYTFTETDEAAERFFNDQTKLTLVNVDIHSVTSLAPVFGYSRNILFTDYAKLETIKLNDTQTIISANEFNGCTSLNYVGGVVEMSTANSAFEGCTSLDQVKIAGTEIPASAFKNSSVSLILNGSKQVVPTYIGKSAFEGNTAIEEMDLTAIEGTNLGESAFNGATTFKGIGKNDVVTLNVTTVPANAFYGTAVVRFQLKKATKTLVGSLDTNALKQIKYRQAAPIVHASQVGDNCSKSDIDIFVKQASDASLFSGYRTVTKEDFDWE